jgi:hypothetical protein
MKKIISKLKHQEWKELNEYIKDFKYDYIGIYLLTKPLAHKPLYFDWDQVFYVGMSNAKRGVRGRLKQFKRAIDCGISHSGGNRFYKEKKYCNSISYSKNKKYLGKKFYIISYLTNCIVDKKVRSGNDLRIMGDICKLEFYLLAEIKDLTGKEPLLNKK